MASAATPQAVASAGVRAAGQVTSVASDSSLSALDVAGNGMTNMAPAFAPGTHDYQSVLNDDGSATVTPTAPTGATVVVRKAGTTYPQVSGTATVPLTRGRNDITVTVTSADATSTSVYRATVWRAASPSVRIVRVSDAHTSVFGGSRMSMVLANAEMPYGCSRSIAVGGRNSWQPRSLFDPETGYTTVTLSLLPAPDHQPGKVDLAVSTTCYPPGGGGFDATTVAKDAVTYTAGLSVDSIETPETMTVASVVTVRGVDVTPYEDIKFWMTDAAGEIRRLDYWDWTGNDNSVVFPDYDGDDAWYKVAGPRTIHVGYCAPGQWQINDACTTVATKVVNWVSPSPSDVSFSPSSGNVAGGNRITLRGKFLASGVDSLTIKVGDREVTDWYTEYQADDDYDTFDDYVNKLDELVLTMPPSSATAPQSITVTTEYGTTVARGTYTYSAKPVITSITPSTVAGSGGSVITVNGMNFGTSGRPAVVIDGVKSPLVTRVNATKVTAVVPTSATRGVVSVTVTSPQGGGVSTAAYLTLVNPSTLPTITALSGSSAHNGDEVTATGTGFGVAGTVGVRVGEMWARVTASTATTVTFEVPSAAALGVQDVTVGATTGSVTKPSALTVLPEAGITTVAPATIPSYATGVAAKVTITGSGFGTTGTVKVGSAAATTYMATQGGTQISGVSVPTTTAGSLPIVVTPTGSTVGLRSSVRVTAPTITYVGSDPYNQLYGPADIETSNAGIVFDVPTTGGRTVRVQGTGFGTAGTIKVAGIAVATTSWSQTAITFTAPAHAAGTVSVTVVPTGSTLTATMTTGFRYATPSVGQPAVIRVASVVDHQRNERNDFDPIGDTSNAFTLTGENLTGIQGASTRVTINDGNQTFTVVPTAVTASSLTFAAPRGFNDGGWKQVTVTTDAGTDAVSHGLYYISAGQTLTVSPVEGLCLRTSTPASNSVTYTPATVTLASSGGAFGDAGTVTIDGVAVSPTSYAAGQIVFSMSSLATELTSPWGGKTIVVTPSDTSLAPQSLGFTCGVRSSVTTLANGSAAHLTVAAGASFALSNSTSGFIGSNPFTAPSPAGYEYVSAEDYASTGFNQRVSAGAPAAAGDYYVRVALSRATYAHEPYLQIDVAPVQVTITGTPVTITPVSDNGSSFTYRGQLGDGTDSSPTDIHYTATTTADPITKVNWQYRDAVCAGQGPTAGWINGLPRDVALSATNCGGDGNTASSWQIRVRSFEMSTSGTNRAGFYTATLPTTTITITPRNLTIGALRADREYDGTTVAVFGTPEVSGAVPGDTISLANPNVGGTFADPTVGVNKPVALAQDLVLAGSAKGNYTLTNPRPSAVGTISKASAVLSLASSKASVLLSQDPTFTITPTVRDARTNQPVSDEANAAPVVLASATPSVCTIVGTTVTARAAGTCTITATQAASVNYTAARAASDADSATESIDVQVLAAPQQITVVADDLTVAVGDNVQPTSEVSGLFDGDSVDQVEYDFYSGSTPVPGTPSTPGTYRIVPKGGILTAASTDAYTNPTAFVYVAGTLEITQLPPTITRINPSTGPTTGGTAVTITGSRLETVRSLRIGAITLRLADLQVNEEGTELVFTAPAVDEPGPVDLILVAGTATAQDVYVYTAPPTPTPTPTATSQTPAPEVLTVGTLTPARGPVSGGTEITVTGRALRTVTAVHIGAATLTAGKFTVNPRGTALTFTTPRVATAGPVNVTFVTPQTTTAPERYTYIAVVPTVPQSVTVSGLDERIAVSFLPPASNGGSPITAYQVSLNAGRTWATINTVAGTQGRRLAVVAKVANGVRYSLRVRALNAIGAGPNTITYPVIANAPRLTPLPNPPGAIPVPKNPQKYTGPQRWTVAKNRTYNGTSAHPIPLLGTRQLTKGEAATLSESGLFGFDSAKLTTKGRAEVKLLASHLRLAHAVQCEGYTDYAGEAKHELTLSQQRSQAVCAALISYGAHVKTVARGYGGARPVIVGGTPRSREANRRVVVLVTN